MTWGALFRGMKRKHKRLTQMIVVIEGADGCGKTSVGKTIADMLEAKLIHFPDDDAVTGPLIRSYLRKGWICGSFDPDGYNGAPLDAVDSAMVFQALQVANRMEHMEEIQECAKSKTKHVVLVRYWQSGSVYGQLDGLDPQWLKSLHATMAQPDLNILLDIDAGTAEARRADRDGDRDPERYEGKLERTKTIVGLYRGLWGSANFQDGWEIIDATDDLPDVIGACVESVQTRLKDFE